jgi:hypothetical protein
MAKRKQTVAEPDAAAEAAKVAATEVAEAEAAAIAAREAAKAADDAEIAAAMAAEVAVAAAAEAEAAAKAAAEEAAEAAAASALADAEKAKADTTIFTLSERASEYIRVLLSQYFGVAVADANQGRWFEAVSSGKQVLVRNKPLRIEMTDTPFEPKDATADVVGDDVLLNVHRQLVHVRLLD